MKKTYKVSVLVEKELNAREYLIHLEQKRDRYRRLIQGEQDAIELKYKKIKTYESTLRSVLCEINDLKHELYPLPSNGPGGKGEMRNG